MKCLSIISWNCKTVQVGEDFRRSLGQPLAQSRVSMKFRHYLAAVVIRHMWS